MALLDCLKLFRDKRWKISDVINDPLYLEVFSWLTTSLERSKIEKRIKMPSQEKLRELFSEKNTIQFALLTNFERTNFEVYL